MQLLGISNNGREVFYINATRDKKWSETLQNKDWVGFIICDSKEVSVISEIAEKSLDKNIGYVCCAGEACELVHDIFDEEICHRVVVKKSLEENAEPMTSWHYNFSEGFWFSIFCANYEDRELDKIICIDFTRQGVDNYLNELLKKINDSWLPSDEKVELPKYNS